MPTVDDPRERRADVVVVGAGHNGLVAATLLARAGLEVLVCEAATVVGGAARTEHPFPRAPQLAQSTGAYLLGLMPPELIAQLGVRIPVLRRDPHYALPAPAGSSVPGLLLGADPEANRTALERAFSTADARADAALQQELAALRHDLAPAWLEEPASIEETADRYIRPGLQDTFVSLCRGSVVEYLDRFGFASERLLAMYAVTDGISGLAAGPDDPGTGHNFLAHNMGRLPEADGTWMLVAGGMGLLARRLLDSARAAGARFSVNTPVRRVLVSPDPAGGAADRAVTGVEVDGPDGPGEILAPVVLAACDPFRLPDLLGDAMPPELSDRLKAVFRPGVTMKVNLALRHERQFPSLDNAPTRSATVHLLPGGEHPLDAVRAMWTDVQAGRLPDFPTIEWFAHAAVDRFQQDPDGHLSSALFVQSVPHVPAGSSWTAELEGYVQHLLALCDRFAPGTSDSVTDVHALPPPGIERHFGITGGHIHHVDNTIAFDARIPYATGVPGLYAGSAGCHPAGSVIGAAGHNAARRILRDLNAAAAG